MTGDASTRAGRWLRVSTNAQDEASQEPDIDRWITQHGYVLAETYRVHGASAFHGEHEPELRRAMKDMAAGRIEVLVVWKSDRLERRGAEALMGLITEAAKAGGRIEFVTEPALNQASDPLIAPMLRAFYGAVAHHESATKADRSIAKHAALRAAGSWMAGQVPYGYMLEAQPDGRNVPGPWRRELWAVAAYRLRQRSGVVIPRRPGSDVAEPEVLVLRAGRPAADAPGVDAALRPRLLDLPRRARPGGGVLPALMYFAEPGRPAADSHC